LFLLFLIVFSFPWPKGHTWPSMLKCRRQVFVLAEVTRGLRTAGILFGFLFRPFNDFRFIRLKEEHPFCPILWGFPFYPVFRSILFCPVFHPIPFSRISCLSIFFPVNLPSLSFVTLLYFYVFHVYRSLFFIFVFVLSSQLLSLLSTCGRMFLVSSSPYSYNFENSIVP